MGGGRQGQAGEGDQAPAHRGAQLCAGGQGSEAMATLSAAACAVVWDIELLTQVFKNPFQEVIDEMNTPKVEKAGPILDPAERGYHSAGVSGGKQPEAEMGAPTTWHPHMWLVSTFPWFRVPLVFFNELQSGNDFVTRQAPARFWM